MKGISSFILELYPATEMLKKVRQKVTQKCTFAISELSFPEHVLTEVSFQMKKVSEPVKRQELQRMSANCED